MKQQKPILHGRDHHPDGVDPIPGLNGGGGGLGVDWEDVGTSVQEDLYEALITSAWATVPPSTEVVAQWGSFDMDFIETITNPNQWDVKFKIPGVYAITGSMLGGPYLPAGNGITAKIYATRNVGTSSTDYITSTIQPPNLYAPYAPISVVQFFHVGDYFRLVMSHTYSGSIDLRAYNVNVVRVGNPVP